MSCLEALHEVVTEGQVPLTHAIQNDVDDTTTDVAVDAAAVLLPHNSFKFLPRHQRSKAVKKVRRPVLHKGKLSVRARALMVKKLRA